MAPPKGFRPWNRGLKGIYSKAVLKSNSDKHKSSYEERYGPERAKEIKKKISIAGSKRKLSEEHKKKIGLNTKKCLTGKPRKTPFSLETRKKISKALKGKPKSKEHKKNLSGKGNGMFGRRGELAPNWQGGLKCLPYDKNFNKYFKLAIKTRDNFTCLKCNLNEVEHKQLYDGQGLVTHHINYNKEDSSEKNCCTLCHRCHGETNFNRKSWTRFFQTLLTERYGYKYKKGETIK